MDEKLVLLLGLGIAGIVISSNCFKDKEDVDTDGMQQRYNERRQQPMYNNEEYYTQQKAGGCSSCNVQYSAPQPNNVVSSNVSPLNFSTMVNNSGSTKENYAGNGLNDYIPLSSYDDNPDKVMVYNSATDSVSLPVTDMTDLSAADNSKYIYDRTIGSLAWTSTKINGRRRSGGDLIRGDLPIIPDSNPMFQVSADPANTLVLGALNIQNGISQTAPTASTVQLATPQNIAAANATTTSGPSGSAHALRHTSRNNFATLEDLQLGSQTARFKQRQRAVALQNQQLTPNTAHAVLPPAPDTPSQLAPNLQTLITASQNSAINGIAQYTGNTLYTGSA